MKILHTADWHIDANIIEAGRCLKFMTDKAPTIQPDLVCVTGDMFNSSDVRLDSDAARLAMITVQRLAEAARFGVLILIGTPSHDGLAAKIFDGLHKVTVFHHPTSMIIDTTDYGGFLKYGFRKLMVSCLPQPTKQYLETVATGNIEDVNLKMAEALTSICAGFGAASVEVDGPHICLGHFSVRGCKISPTQQMIGYDIQMSADQLQLAKPTIWCLGHIHHAQEVAPNVFYSGSIYRVDFGERESEKGFFAHTVEGSAISFSRNVVESEFITTPAATMNKVKFDMGKDYDISDDEITDKMQIEIKLYADEAAGVDMDAIKEDLIARGAKEVDIILQRLPRPNVRSAKVLAVERLRDKLIARAEITDEEVAPGILEKADWIESMKYEAVMAIIEKQFAKGESE